jgi:hypothetical protein
MFKAVNNESISIILSELIAAFPMWLYICAFSYISFNICNRVSIHGFFGVNNFDYLDSFKILHTKATGNLLFLY